VVGSLPTAAAIAHAGITLPADAVIAIDGPAGSGKSTTARALARRFGLTYIDSGAMYRALTLAARRNDISSEDGDRLAALLAAARLELRDDRRESSVIWDGQDVSSAIRTPEIDRSVSRVSSHASVRAVMVERQRELGRRGSVVMEGRDIGSVVFPLATAKIYLDASLAAREARRHRQFRDGGRTVAPQEVRRELAERDRRDSERAESPLTISPDAIVLDTSDWSLAEQIERAAETCLINPYLDTLLDTDRESAVRALPLNYRIAYACFDQIARFFGLRQIGYNRRSVPAGIILVSNHVHWYDPPIIGATFLRSPLRTLAKEELIHGPLGFLFRLLDIIPIHRKGYDADAFGEARRALQNGSCLFIFPEGTRRPVGRPGPVKNGLGILCQETGADVLPLFIRGTWGLMPGGSPRSPLEVRYGPMVRLHALPILQRQYDRQEVNRRIAKLFETIFCELQARCYRDRPETPFEQGLFQRLTRKFAAKDRRLFGPSP